MRTKITICTPVHVGTGEIKLNSEYIKRGNTLSNYDLAELLGKSSQNLLDEAFLNSLMDSSPGSKKEALNKLINDRKRRSGSSEFDRMYSLRFGFERMPRGDVMVQAKTLNQPFIPGSTLKGAILNCIYYDFVLRHYEDLCEYLESSIGKFVPEIDSFVKYVYRNDPDVELITEFMENFRNCIVCRDTIYSKLCFLETIRENVFTGAALSVPNLECIDSDQNSKNSRIIYFDIGKKSILKDKYEGTNFYSDFRDFLSYKKIVNVSKQFFQDMIGEEITVKDKIKEYDSDPENIESFNSDIQNSEIRIFYSKIESYFGKFIEDEKNNSFHLRIGGRTNYFYKTVSYLIKKNNEDFYNTHFRYLFSPKKGIKGPEPSPFSMPVTRTLCTDGKNTYYPGIIKVEFIQEPKD